MDTQKAIELLPWYLNGSLSEDERRQVEEQLASSEECRTALEQTRAAARIFAVRLPGEALVDQVFGAEDIAPGEAARHRSPRAVSGDDLELMELIRQSKAALDWSEQTDRKREAAQPAPATPAVTHQAAGHRWRLLAVAASVAFAVTTSGWLWSSNRPGAPAASGLVQAELQPGIHFVELEPQSTYRDGGLPTSAGAPTATISSAQPQVVLSLTVATATPESVRVEIRDAQGTLVRRSDAAPGPTSIHYEVLLTTAGLPLGELELRLVTADSGELLGSYALRVEA
jgi:hypothetical protein